MRESRFIDQNLDKWQKIERAITSEKLPAEEMESAFVELNDDLAYARTFYKNRAVRLFLNNLLAPVYNTLHRGRRANWKSIVTFFTVDAPRMNFAARKYMLVSLFTVLIGFSIGYFSTRHDPEFANTILGNDYVRMTEANIAKGDPLAVYKQESPGAMFQHIATNNLRVAAYFFLFGALFCIGAMYLLMSNGIMLGAFTYLFTSRGLATEYVLTVYQHGTLEILTMVIEGAAGIMLGAGMLFPGTLSRTRSIQNAARKSIVMFLVCVPIIVLAAFIESYLTRFTGLSTALRSSIIILSLFFMLYYFIIYPFIKFRKDKSIEGNYDGLKPDAHFFPKAGEIYTLGNMVLFGFEFIKKHSLKFGILAMASVLVLLPVSEYFSENAISDEIKEHFNSYYFTMRNHGSDMEGSLKMGMSIMFFNIYASCYFFSANIDSWVLLSSFISIAVVFFMVLWWNRAMLEATKGSKINAFIALFYAAFSAALMVGVNSISGSAWWFFTFTLLPLCMFIAVQGVIAEKFNPLMAVAEGIKLMFSFIGKYLGNVIVGMLLYFIFMFGLLYLIAILVTLTMQFHGMDFLSIQMMYFFLKFNYFILPVLLALCSYISFMLSLSLFEANTGKSLYKRMSEIKFKREFYGIESE